MRIEGKRIIVTGASSGIGRAVALELAGRGAGLTLASRRTELLESAAREISERFPSSPSPEVVRCDVRVNSDVSALIGATVERHGSIDVLVNNAGISAFGEAKRTPLEDYAEIVNVNYLGAVRCALEALPFMLRRGSGTIVNVATVAALHGVPYLAAYGASKAALVSFSESIRVELEGTGVGVMLVYPGYTRTEIFDVEKKVGGARRPPGRYAEPALVARAVAAGIEAERREVFLTLSGRLLSILRGAAPWIVESAMRRIAREQRDTDGPPVSASPGRNR